MLGSPPFGQQTAHNKKFNYFHCFLTVVFRTTYISKSKHGSILNILQFDFMRKEELVTYYFSDI